jgi:hypothetical protein
MIPIPRLHLICLQQDKQEQRRKTVKQHVADKNMDYTNYRTRDFIKVNKRDRKENIIKCTHHTLVGQENVL